MLAEMEAEVKRIKNNLKAAQDRQKMYVDKKISYREFTVGERVYVRVKPKRSTMRWTSCAKLAPRYCGPFQILERVRPVAYKLALPSHIQVHNVFHVSLLKRYVHDERHVIHWQNIQVGKRDRNPNVRFEKLLYADSKLLVCLGRTRRRVSGRAAMHT